MSVIDGYEYQRRPWRRGKQRARPNPQRAKKETQLALKLYGGTTAPDKGAHFDDPIDQIGR